MQLPRSHRVPENKPQLRAIVLTGRNASPHTSAQCLALPGASADVHVGMDFGTSGARLNVINGAGDLLFDTRRLFGSEPNPVWTQTWEGVLFELLSRIPAELAARVASIGFDGTSATALLVDKDSGSVLVPAKLYNESQGQQALAAAKALAPSTHTATASTSTLCKLLTWQLDGSIAKLRAEGHTPVLLHQADWLSSLLTGRRDVSDWNNALKLGFDPETEAWAPWLQSQKDLVPLLPPNVLAPGAPTAQLSSEICCRFGLPSSCWVVAGTTDSIAAFIAADVSASGQAVTSLGSTLAVKMLSDKRVDDAAYGVYSHRLGDVWLVGGASNTGGAVLRQFFTIDELAELTQRIDPDRPTGLDYYPLPSPGERFPVNDPATKPRLEPRPQDDALFLQGIFEGIAAIEGRAYSLLTQLGASKVKEVKTAGGGAVNEKWTKIRARTLGVPVSASKHGEAAYGAALLARQGFGTWSKQGCK